MWNIIAILIIVLMAVMAFYLYRTLLIRGIRKVVTIFRACEAVKAKGARTLEELGLQPAPYLRRVFRARDYKQTAAELLFRQGIILSTGDGRFYLSETVLEQSQFHKYVGTE